MNESGVAWLHDRSARRRGPPFITCSRESGGRSSCPTSEGQTARPLHPLPPQWDRPSRCPVREGAQVALRNLEMHPRASAAEGHPCWHLWAVWATWTRAWLRGWCAKHGQRATSHRYLKKACRARVPDISSLPFLRDDGGGCRREPPRDEAYVRSHWPGSVPGNRLSVPTLCRGRTG